MGSSTDVPAPLHNALRSALAAGADDDGFVPFAHFMHVALYHPTEGYYRRERNRVGRSPDTDFYTAASLGPVFGEVAAAAAVNLLGAAAAADHTWVELGAEAGRSVLDGVSHPFKGIRRIGAADALELSGPCVVFSNELFDAQPCVRLRRDAGGWSELGVRVGADGHLHEASRPAAKPAALGATDLPPGYHLDLPFAAAALTRQIARQPWSGLFLAFDYGKSWRELSTACPQGTVRAYHRHRQHNDLLLHPGEQDLTCHVCWDWMADALCESGFTVAAPLDQEVFLVSHAGAALARIMAEEAVNVSARKTGLLQLLHPAALGRKFQVLSARRTNP